MANAPVCVLLLGCLVTGVSAKWPIRASHADAVPASFDLAMRKVRLQALLSLAGPCARVRVAAYCPPPCAARRICLRATGTHVMSCIPA